MSSMLSSQGVVLATAMAVSGTVLLLAFRLQKSSQTTQFSIDQVPQSSQQALRSCISSDEKKREKKTKKKVHFAEDVVDPRGNGEEFRRQHGCRKTSSSASSSSSSASTSLNPSSPVHFKKIKGMPANRVALYNGILRDRVIQRVAYSH